MLNGFSRILRSHNTPFGPSTCSLPGGLPASDAPHLPQKCAFVWLLAPHTMHTRNPLSVPVPYPPEIGPCWPMFGMEAGGRPGTAPMPAPAAAGVIPACRGWIRLRGVGWLITAEPDESPRLSSSRTGASYETPRHLRSSASNAAEVCGRESMSRAIALMMIVSVPTLSLGL